MLVGPTHTRGDTMPSQCHTHFDTDCHGEVQDGSLSSRNAGRCSDCRARHAYCAVCDSWVATGDMVDSDEGPACSECIENERAYGSVQDSGLLHLPGSALPHRQEAVRRVSSGRVARKDSAGFALPRSMARDVEVDAGVSASTDRRARPIVARAGALFTGRGKRRPVEGNDRRIHRAARKGARKAAPSEALADIPLDAIGFDAGSAHADPLDSMVLSASQLQQGQGNSDTTIVPQHSARIMEIVDGYAGSDPAARSEDGTGRGHFTPRRGPTGDNACRPDVPLHVGESPSPASSLFSAVSP